MGRRNTKMKHHNLSVYDLLLYVSQAWFTNLWDKRMFIKNASSCKTILYSVFVYLFQSIECGSPGELQWRNLAKLIHFSSLFLLKLGTYYFYVFWRTAKWWGMKQTQTCCQAMTGWKNRDTNKHRYLSNLWDEE